MRIHEKGNPDGAPLVLLHGLASSARCWERTLPELERDRRLLLVDLFAGGTRRFSLEDAATQLAEELRARGVTRADLVGHSMGGLIALHVATSSPDLVSSLVLVGVPAMRVTRARIGRLGAVARSSISRRASAVSLVVGSLLRTSPLRVLAATRATLRADLAAQAAAATGIPTLLVWGAEDRIVPVEVGLQLARRMPDAELVVIPVAGHQPMWERPEAFSEALAAFLDR